MLAVHGVDVLRVMAARDAGDPAVRDVRGSTCLSRFTLSTIFQLDSGLMSPIVRYQRMNELHLRTCAALSLGR
jgi:hypothetical protein